MSKIKAEHIFTSESVSEGHPDKVADQISDALLDAALEQDPESHVAAETLVTTDLVVVAGEIASKAKVNWEGVVRETIREIGYTDPEIGFSADSAKVFLALHSQSPDIAQGVNEGEGLHKEQGAGDQGMVFGYASDETKELMPAPVLFSHKIVEELARLRKSGQAKYKGLRPDSKSQVSILYKDGKPVRVETIVVSHQHDPGLGRKELEEIVKKAVKKAIPAKFLHPGIKYHVNPTGRFVVGGPNGDSGLTGRKIIVDSYGGVGSHGGGAFSGKDPSKVDRSGAYIGHYIAKNIVASGLASKAEVQIAYAIGVAKPVSVNVDVYGTGKIAEEKLALLIQQVFDLTPAGIIKALDLKHPKKNGWSYKQTAAYGHFGREIFPWERIDKAEELKAAAKKLIK